MAIVGAVVACEAEIGLILCVVRLLDGLMVGRFRIIERTEHSTLRSEFDALDTFGALVFV